MLGSLEKFANLRTKYKVLEIDRHDECHIEDTAIQKERNATLRKLRATHTAEEKTLLADWEKEDVKRMKDRLREERRATTNLLNKIPRLMAASNGDALPTALPISVEDDGEIEFISATSRRSSSKKRAHSPDVLEPEATQPTTISAFERRRLDNLAKNKALLDDIAPPKTPTKPKQRRMLNTPKAPSKKVRISPRAIQNDSKFEDDAKNDDIEILSVSGGSPLSSPPTSFASWSQEPEPRSVAMEDVNSWDHVVEFPLKSNRFYLMRCVGCSEGLGSVAEMLVHLQGSNHRHLLRGNETCTNAVKVCGKRILDATYEWVAGGSVRFNRRSEVKESRDEGSKIMAVNNMEIISGEGSASTVEPASTVNGQKKSPRLLLFKPATGNGRSVENTLTEGNQDIFIMKSLDNTVPRRTPPPYAWTSSTRVFNY